MTNPLIFQTARMTSCRYCHFTLQAFLKQQMYTIVKYLDDNNNPINFNNIDWTMTLLFKIDFIDNSDSNTSFNSILNNNSLNY